MPRLKAKVDANQPEIVRVLRGVGANVQHLHMVGRGCPDILVGFRGRNFLLEIKDGSLPPSRRGLTKDELDWHDAWQGQVAVVNDADEALRAIGAT